MKTFIVGTALCIVAGLVVIAVNLANVPRVWVIAALPLLLVGFGIQMYAAWKYRPRND